MGKMQLNNINLPNRGEIPSGKLTVCELEHGPVEIVDFPINSMVDLSIVFCHRLPGRVNVIMSTLD